MVLVTSFLLTSTSRILCVFYMLMIIHQGRIKDTHHIGQLFSLDLLQVRVVQVGISKIKSVTV